MKLSELITEYIEFKQSLGMSFESNAVLLRAFCTTVGNVDVQEVKYESVVAYLYGKGPVTSYWYNKFRALTGLYRYAIARRYVAHSRLPTTIPKHPTPYVAYIYTPKELNLLLEAADTLEATRCHMDGLSFRTLLLLLFNTGLRIGETLSLTIADVSFSEDLLIIRDGKFGKSRLVPIDHRLGVVLQKYAEMKHAARSMLLITHRINIQLSLSNEMAFRRLSVALKRHLDDCAIFAVFDERMEHGISRVYMTFDTPSQ